MDRATDKQIIYCEAICKELGIEEPNYESKQETFYFLRNYVPIYKKKMNQEELDNGMKFVRNKLSNEAISFLKENDDKIGIYLFWHKDYILYVGKTTKKNTHRVLSSYKERKGKISIDFLSFIEIDNIADLNILEIILISELKPLYNKDCVCDDNPAIYRSEIDIDDLVKIEWEVNKDESI